MRISKALHTFLSVGIAAGATASLAIGLYPRLRAWSLLLLLAYPVLLWCAQALVDLSVSRLPSSDSPDE